MDSTHAIPEACDHNRVRLRGCLFCGFFASSSAKIESKECHHGPEGLSRNLNPRRWGHLSRNLYTHSMFSFSPANQPRTTFNGAHPHLLHGGIRTVFHPTYYCGHNIRKQKMGQKGVSDRE